MSWVSLGFLPVTGTLELLILVCSLNWTYVFFKNKHSSSFHHGSVASSRECEPPQMPKSLIIGEIQFLLKSTASVARNCRIPCTSGCFSESA